MDSTKDPGAPIPFAPVLGFVRGGRAGEPRQHSLALSLDELDDYLARRALLDLRVQEGDELDRARRRRVFRSVFGDV